MTVTPTTVAAMTPQQFSDHARALFARAVPHPDDLPTVNRLMAEAKGKGMTWVEGLEYAIERRSALR